MPPRSDSNDSHGDRDTRLKTTGLDYFCLCFYFDSHQKGTHFYHRSAILREGGAIDVCGGSCPKMPPWVRHCPWHISQGLVYGSEEERRKQPIVTHHGGGVS